MNPDAHGDASGDIAARAAAAASAADTDRYFLAASCGKPSASHRRSAKSAGTSGRGLATLPSRPDQEAARGLAQRYAESLVDTAPDYRDRYETWSRWMRVGGFSLLFWGAGSKWRLLRDFRATCLADELCMEFDCYHPDASPKAVLSAILEELVGAGSCCGGKSLLEMARLAANELEKAGLVLYLLVHGLDGPQMRTDKAVEALAALAASPSVRLAASLDHRLCQLLWDQSQLCAMSCLWCRTPTSLPHIAELPDSAAYTGRAFGHVATRGGDPAGGASAVLQLSGLRHLMASLTKNARELFVLLARRQLEHPGEPWPLEEIYWACLERMIVTSELTLHAHLKEFRDHGLVRLRTGTSGGGQAGDTALVPLPTETLAQFLAIYGDDFD